MKNVAKIISCYAADISGVCSALYELGGMVVIHDASGCNSTYTTHDEPRWTKMRSMIYISGLTEIDAIMGNDERLINDIAAAVSDQHPKFIAVCGSAMPMMIGTDFDALAEETERRTGIRTFPVKTNGTRSYLYGESNALLDVVKEYTSPLPKKPNTVNILGATPLDFSLNGSVESIQKWLADNDFEIIMSLSMGCSIDDIKRAAAAEVNLVISYSGLAAAEYMQTKYDIPYICGVPYGKKLALELAQKLKAKKTAFACAERQVDSKGIYIIGEGIMSGSLARAVELETGLKTRVVCPLDHKKELLADGDSDFYAEEDIEALLQQNKPLGVIADPLYKFIVPRETAFYALPHFAFSGRCYERQMSDLINNNALKELLK